MKEYSHSELKERVELGLDEYSDAEIEAILKYHGAVGHVLADGNLRLLSEWTLGGKFYSEWTTEPREELMCWLGY